MRKLLIGFIVIVLLGVATATGLLINENSKANKLKETALSGYGDPLVSNELGGSNSQVLSQISGQNSANGPSKEELQKYEQYKDAKQILFGEIKVGDGAQAKAGSAVAVGYTGYLTTGQVFDKTTTKAFSFVVGQHKVVPGFEQGVFGMKVGGKRRVIIPPALGYGNKQAGQIPANSVLVFDIELLAVQ